MKSFFSCSMIMLLTYFLFTTFHLIPYNLTSGSVVNNGSRQVFSVLVKDAKEAAMLQQKFSLDVAKINGIRLYYFDINNSISQKLKAMGYDQIRREEMGDDNTRNAPRQQPQIDLKDIPITIAAAKYSLQ